MVRGERLQRAHDVGLGLVGGTTLLKTIKAKSKSTIRVKSRLFAVNNEPR